MKKLLKIIAIVIVLLVAVIVTVPFLIPAETYKAEITRQVYAQTGRMLKIEGDVGATIYPAIGAKLGKVSLSNPEGFSSPTLVELNELTVDVALIPLFSGEVQVQRFLLDQPIIHLEVNAKGKANWEFEPQVSPAPAARSFQLISSAHADEDENDILKTLSRLKLGEVKITDGTVFFSDKKSKLEQSASKVNLTVGLPSVDAEFTFVGDAVWNNEKLSVDLSLATLRDLLNGHSAKTKLALKSTHANLDFSGVATLKGAKGQTQFSTPSLVQLAKWAGAGFDWKGKGKLAFDAKGELNCKEKECDFTQATLQLDSLKATGALGFDLDDTVPEVKATLATELLDTADFLPVGAQKQAQLLEWLIASAHAAPAAGWSTDPIDLSGLKAVDAEIALTAGKIRHENIEIGKTVLKTQLEKGALALDVVEIALYGGAGKGRITANTANRLGVQFAAKGIQAEPFLKAVTGDDRLSGALELNLAVNTQGNNQQQLVKALAGNGLVRFTDGALKGINIAQMVRDAKAMLTQKQNESLKTDFAELGGNFTIANGIVSNDDLSMKAPLFRLGGKGTVDLPQMVVNYRLLPTLVNSLKGQGGIEKAGLTVPIIVEGPLTAPTYRPDLAGMAQDYMNDPEKAKEALKDLKAGLKDGKGDLKDSLKDGKASLKELKKDPDALKGLLQGLGR